MTQYINPQSQTKEAFLRDHGTPIVPPSALPSDPTVRLVCLVDNGPFTAAGVCDTDRDLDCFTDPTDYRIRTWYEVPANVLDESVLGAPLAVR